MRNKVQLLSLLLLAVAFYACSGTAKNQQSRLSAKRKAEIKTNYGTIVVKLYDSTPLHRDNFVSLVQSKFYDSLLFHRIIDGFMIQGGDPTSKYADSSANVGEGEGTHKSRVPAEFKPYYIHKKGALAAARDNNPAKASSNCQFYLVQGKVYTDSSLNAIECNRIRPNNPSFAYTEAQRTVYKTIGGTPFLDQNYTVFGEVVKGIEVIDIIAKLPRDKRDRPLKEARIVSIKMLN
ncbi:MAG: peptidylprolyl isomerase [Filimonas sp.]|nr:peptidylprolyl isomerase [Filimonas sp.]